MRGSSSIFVGVLLVAVASWTFSTAGFGTATLICAVAGAFFLFLGARGMALGEAGDPVALVDFVRDPAGAIVDTATDRIGDWLNNDKPGAAAAAEKPKFDPDAVIERYLAQRGGDAVADSTSAAATASPGPAPTRTFGRKGI